MFTEEDGQGAFNHFHAFGVAFGFPPEACQKLTNIAVEPLNDSGEMLGGQVLVGGHNMAVSS